MKRTSNRVLAAGAIALLATASLAIPADARQTMRSSGEGTRVSISWTEFDPDNLVGAPGNVHIGYLYAENGPYGTYFFGNVTDFECAPGQTPFFGHHGVVDEGADVAQEATGDAIEVLIDSGQATVDATFVVDTIADEIISEIPDEILEESSGCSYMGDRFLEGDSNIVMTVDARKQVATITGNLIVSTGGHGHGGTILGQPPVNITITGGDWNKWDYSYSSKGQSYSYSNSEKGTDWNGGAVTGAIGAMNFADDADDVSYGSFTSYSFRTVERIR